MIRGTAATLVVPTSYHSNPWIQMENSAYEADIEKGALELSDMRHNESIDSKPPLPQGHSCQPDVCRRLHAKYVQDKSKMTASPWHRLKTLFLVGIISLLSLWVLAYVASSRMGLV